MVTTQNQMSKSNLKRIIYVPIAFICAFIVYLIINSLLFDVITQFVTNSYLGTFVNIIAIIVGVLFFRFILKSSLLDRNALTVNDYNKVIYTFLYFMFGLDLLFAVSMAITQSWNISVILKLISSQLLILAYLFYNKQQFAGNK